MSNGDGRLATSSTPCNIASHFPGLENRSSRDAREEDNLPA